MGAKRKRVDGRKSHAGQKQNQTGWKVSPNTLTGLNTFLIKSHSFEILISAYFTLWNTVFHFLQIEGMTQSKGFVSVCVFLFFVVLVLCFFLPHQGRKLMKPGKIPQHQVQWNAPHGPAIYISYSDDDDFSLAGKDILGQRIKPKVETEVVEKKRS